MKQRKINKASLINIIIFINILSCIGIPCLEHYFTNIKIIYLIFNVISFIILCFSKAKIKINGFIKYIVIYYILLFTSTIFNHGDTYQLIYEFISVLCTLILLNTVNKEESKQYINIMYLCLEILTYLDLLIIILYPQGLYNLNSSRSFYLFNHVNEAIRFLLPGVCFCMLRSYLNNNKLDKRSYLYFTAVIITLLLTWPATGIVGFAFFFALVFILLKKPSIVKLFKPIYSYIVSLIASYILIFKGINSIFINSIFTFLKRDITLTGRTVLWSNTINNIKQKLFLGYGRQDTQYRKNNIGAISSHNNFLDIVFEGGLLLLICFFIMMIVISSKLKKCNNSKIVIVLSVTIFSYAIMWITLPFSYSGTSLMFIVWLITYYSPILFNKKEGLQNE